MKKNKRILQQFLFALMMVIVLGSIFLNSEEKVILGSQDEDIPEFNSSEELESLYEPEEEYIPDITNPGISIYRPKEEEKEVELVNNPRTMEELRYKLFTELKSRPRNLRINYYGKDMNVNTEFHDIMDELNDNGKYQTSNIDNWAYLLSKNRDQSINIDIDFEYRTSQEEETFIDKEVTRIVKEIIHDDMRDVEKVKAVYDYIVDNKIYTYDVPDPYGPYYFFKENKGVCNSFALAMCRLLDKAGIDNYFVAGSSIDKRPEEERKDNEENEDISHAWNKVKVNDVWYNLDVTWAEPTSEYGLSLTYYYFLVSDKRFYEDHEANTVKYIPASEDTSYDGFYDCY